MEIIAVLAIMFSAVLVPAGVIVGVLVAAVRRSRGNTPPVSRPVQKIPPVQPAVHLSRAVPSSLPPRRTPVQGSLNVQSAEGMELHPAGFHGEKAESEEILTAQADFSQENQGRVGNTVRTHNRRPAGAPRLTARSLRQGYVLQEILGEPVSRRQRGWKQDGR